MKGKEISTYPEDSHIVFKSIHRSWDYIIINKRVYPPLHKLVYTKKPEQYPIPDQYIFDKYIVHSKKSPLKAATKYCKPFNDLSNSTQRRHMLTMAKCVFDQVETYKENLFNKNDKVEIKQAQFTINNMPFEIQYGKVNQNDIEDLNLAVLKSLDKGKISREAFRSLIRINQDLPRKGAISNTRQKLNEQMKALVPLLLINQLNC
ncbi:13365_t:CDS:2 [Gigaspora rosea]|nr:13365_t:CDS:2 [Gigaspora rosea]